MKVFARILLGGAIAATLVSPASATFAGQKDAYAAAIRRSFTEPDFLYNVALSHPFLLFLIASIAVLFIMSCVFCGLAVTYRRRNNAMAARWIRMEAEWEPYVVSVLNGEQLPVSVGDHVRGEDRLYFVDFLTRFTMRFQGEELEKISELARPFLPDVAAHLHMKSAAQRARAVQTLGVLAFSRYSVEILNALDDESPLVAMIAARTLSKKEHPEYVEPVILRLYRFHQWSPKFLASMLSTIGPKAAPLLRKAYAERSNDSQVRAVAAESLRMLNDLSSADLAATVLAEEKESETLTDREKRRRSAESARSSEKEMEEARLEGFDPGVAAASSAPVEPVREAVEGIPHPHRDLIASSLRLVRSFGRPEHADTARLFCDSSDFVLREFAFRALGRVGGGEDVQRLQDALDDSSVWVALHAARALRELGAENALRTLAEIEQPRSDIARQVLAESVR
ncbi:MAG: HEAT repeat domain-containing protein [Candidatus Hydrogenedentota bacterium]